MRCAAFAVVLVFAGSAHAQSGVAGTGTRVWGGVPRNIVNTPVDTSKAVGMSSNLSKAFKTPSAATNSPFNIGKAFHSFSLPSWPPKNAQVSVLPQNQNPYQPTPPKGAVNLFNYPKKK